MAQLPRDVGEPRPNTNTDTRSRSLVMACRKCRNIREYGFIDPEMSHRTTSGGCSSRGAARTSGITSPPPRRDSRSVFLKSIRLPLRSTWNLLVLITGSGRRSSAISFFASASSAADMVSKSMRCSTSREEKVSRASSSTFSVFASCCF